MDHFDNGIHSIVNVMAGSLLKYKNAKLLSRLTQLFSNTVDTQKITPSKQQLQLFFHL